MKIIEKRNDIMAFDWELRTVKQNKELKEQGGPYASLHDGNKMTMSVCNTLCAVYNIPTTQEKSILFGAYMVFIWFHNHCKLALLGPEAQGAYERFVQQTWPLYGLCVCWLDLFPTELVQVINIHIYVKYCNCNKKQPHQYHHRVAGGTNWYCWYQ